MEKFKKLAIIGNIIFITLIVTCDILFMSKVFSKYFIKTLTSMLFVLCGIYNLLLTRIYYKDFPIYKSIIMLIGLIFAFLGDVLLIDYFVIGALLFAIGHVFFTIYFMTLVKIHWIDFLIGLLIFVLGLLLILLYPNFQFDGMKLLVVFYALIISLMLGKAISNLMKQRTLANLITMLGALLFFFSDLMLLFNVFTNLSNIFDYLCLSTYYPAEFMLAISILLQAISFNKNKKALEGL